MVYPFSVPISKFQDNTTTYSKIESYHPVSNALFSYYPTI